jgi:adenylyltransferase/sulfurtransferase
MNLSRYSCQVALPGFGRKGQQLLQQARVLIVGMGGLGCPAAQYLAASGIGTLGIADNDTVSISNLHRQLLYAPADTGKYKVLVATERLQQQNPDIRVVPHQLRVNHDNVLSLFEQYDMIIDGTDNFETRYLLNDAAVLLGKPLVYGAIYQFEGQVAVWNAPNPDGSRTPNYRDVFPQVDAVQVPNCAEGGVTPTLAGIIGCMQAGEVIKYITGTGELLAGKLLMLDVQTLQSRIVGIGKITRVSITALPQAIAADTIPVSELKAGLAADAIELLDIRGSEEHDYFNIGGKHVPAYKLMAYLGTLDGSRKVVLYCTIGKRSADIVKQVKKTMPSLAIYSLQGGIKAWLEEDRD